MAIGCEDLSARMMELLYGELGGQERAAVEVHLAGCASCRAELAAFQGTRTAARRALDADAPPARVHDAILRAAAAAVAAKKPQAIEARPATSGPSFWERLRGRWTLPTFATVGAVAVVVLASKVFLEPEKTVELGRQTVAPPAKEAPRAQAIVDEGPARNLPAPAAAAAPEEKELAKELADREKSHKRQVSKRATAPQAAAKPASAAAASSIDRLLGAESGTDKGLGSRGGHREMSDDNLDGLRGEGANSDKSFREGPAAKPGKREFAPPPPPRAQPAPAPAAPTSAPPPVEEDDVVEASPRRRVGGAGAPGGGAGPPPAAHTSPKMKKAAEEDEMESATADEEGDAPAPSRAAPAEKRRAPAKNDKAAAQSPVAQADRLFSEGRWAEAARAYRELLRSDPRNADAGRWKQRLAAAEAALAPPAHAASKKAAAPP